MPFETAIIKRYKRRESSIEEALIEMYLAGVSVRRIEDITEALWGTKVSPGTISELNKKVYGHIETWRNRGRENKASWLEFLRSLKERGLTGTQLLSEIAVWDWWKPWGKSSPKPDFSVVSCIFTGMYFRLPLPGRFEVEAMPDGIASIY